MVLSSHQLAVYTYTDADKLQYVVNVLISAAIDISPANTTVLIKTTCSGGIALVEVTDSSHGMNEVISIPTIAQQFAHTVRTWRKT